MLTPSDNKGALIQSERSLFKRLVDRVFGFDFFVSYSWGDGWEYAEALTRELEALNFDVFLDRDDFHDGANWKSAGAWSLRRTSKLILVGTPGSLESKPVQYELQVFAETGRTVIPISIDGALGNLPADHAFRKHLGDETLRIEEIDERRLKAPSAGTIGRIAQSFDILRQDQKRMRWLQALIVIFALISSIAVWQSFVAEGERQDAIEARDEAQIDRERAIAARDQADIERDNAREAQKDAEEARENEEQERVKAELATQRALEQTRLAVAAQRAERRALFEERNANLLANQRLAEVIAELAYQKVETDLNSAVRLALQSDSITENSRASRTLFRAYNERGWFHTAQFSGVEIAELSNDARFVATYNDETRMIAVHDLESGAVRVQQVSADDLPISWLTANMRGDVITTAFRGIEERDDEGGIRRNSKRQFTLFRLNGTEPPLRLLTEQRSYSLNCGERSFAIEPGSGRITELYSGLVRRLPPGMVADCTHYSERVNVPGNVSETDELTFIPAGIAAAAYLDDVYDLRAAIVLGDSDEYALVLVDQGTGATETMQLGEFRIVSDPFFVEASPPQPGGIRYLREDLGFQRHSEDNYVSSMQFSSPTELRLLRTDGTFVRLNTANKTVTYWRFRGDLQGVVDLPAHDVAGRTFMADKSGQIRIYDPTMRQVGRVDVPPAYSAGFRRAEIPFMSVALDGSRLLAGSRDLGYFVFSPRRAEIESDFAFADTFGSTQRGSRGSTLETTGRLCSDGNSSTQADDREILLCFLVGGEREYFRTGYYGHLFKQPEITAIEDQVFRVDFSSQDSFGSSVTTSLYFDFNLQRVRPILAGEIRSIAQSGAPISAVLED